VYGAQHPPLTEPLGSPPRSAGPKSKRQQEQQIFDNFNFQTADVWADTTEEDFATLSLDSALNQKEKVEDEGASVKLGKCRVLRGLEVVCTICDCCQCQSLSRLTFLKNFWLLADSINHFCTSVHYCIDFSKGA